jgi:3-polyprenyl-4-hydroxybenzoate decarboxylase
MEKNAVKWVRAAVVRAVEHRDSVLLFGTDGVVRRLDGDSATLARVVLEFAVAPRTRDELLAHLAALSGAPVEHAQVVDELVELLLTAGALVHASDVPAPIPAGSGKRVVVAITGAIAALHTPGLVLALQRRGFEVRVAATKAALRLCRPEGLAALTHHPVQVSLWSRDASTPVPHLHLAEWAHAILVCPASATTLSRIATGNCGTLVSALAIAARVPVVLVPSMNRAMYFAPSVQRNLELLRADGFHVMQPAMGTEVAEAPAARESQLGAAPPPKTVADVLTELLRLSTVL